MARKISAPRGSKLSCKSWQTEAAYRMIQNNLDQEVAEDPDNLVVYGGNGKAARNWEAFEAILNSLRNLEIDQTLLVQSGKPVGVFRTHPDAPRVLIANSNLVAKWATAEYFRDLEAKGLMMYGQMTAGSWIYIGTQGILQGTYQTFVAAGEKHFGGDLSGRVILSGGLGGMGGAQPLAATLAGAIFLGIEVDKVRLERRIAQGYLDTEAESLDHAISIIEHAKKEKKAISIGLCANCAELLPELLKRGFIPDLVTDQTSAHDELNGYVPHGITLANARALRKADPKRYREMARNSMVKHCKAICDLQSRGAIAFDYGNNLRGQALEAGFKEAFSYPGFVPAYVRPLFCQGSGPFRWVALSGDPADIAVTDQAILEAFPEDRVLTNWLTLAPKKIKFQGLPARICWLPYGARAKAGRILNQLVKSKRVSAPIVIGRDHLDCGSVASPNRETEAMKDGSDAVADWPLLNAMLNVAGGATWVSIHHGGGVGIGYSQHAGVVIVADGTEEADRRLERVLTCDPGMGVIRHVDAGYEEAQIVARNKGIIIPMESR